MHAGQPIEFVHSKPVGRAEDVTVLSDDDYAGRGVTFVTEQLRAGLPPHHIALLFRLRDMAVPVEHLLGARGIRHIRCSRESFFERRVVVRVRAWLRVVEGSSVPADYSTALAWPTRYLRADVLDGLTASPGFADALAQGQDQGLRWLDSWGGELGETKGHAVSNFVVAVRESQKFKTPAEMLDSLNLRRAAESETAPPSEAPPTIILDIVRRPAAQFGSVRELESWIATRGQDKDYAIGGDEDASIRKREGCVNLATIHQVKGQEFPAVGVLGPLDGMPDRRARLTAELEEERRIAYVAVTRAEERLLFCASAQYAVELGASPRSGDRLVPDRRLDKYFRWTSAAPLRGVSPPGRNASTRVNVPSASTRKTAIELWPRFDR